MRVRLGPRGVSATVAKHSSLLRRTLPCAALVAWLPCAATAAAGSDDQGPPMPFGEAVTVWHNGDRNIAMKAFTRLAEAGDARSQLVLSTLLTEGRDVPRDLVQAYAWAEIATSDYVYKFGGSAIDLARKQKSALELYLSGADLIKGDRIAAAYLDAQRDDVKRREKLAVDMLTGQASHPEVQMVSGCALDPAMPICESVRDRAVAGRSCSGPDGRPDRWPTTLGPDAAVVKPRYPTLARQNAWEGKFLFIAHVDRNGYPCRIAVVRGSGYRVIDAAVLKALPVWRFQPALKDGQPVEAIFPASVEHGITDYQFYGDKK